MTVAQVKRALVGDGNRWHIAVMFHIALILSLALASTTLFADGQHRRFSGESVSFEFDATRYQSITEAGSVERGDGSTPAQAYNLTLHRRHAIGESDADAGTVCLLPLNTCANRGGGELPYWLDEGSELRIFGPTEPVRRRTLGGRLILEAFPLCGWHDGNDWMPYGGQCYVAVLPLESKVVSFTFLLGKASGCKQYERCWAGQLRATRRMLATVR
ncbi:hypothetical protein [Cupriavidus gilardii]|uniref:hypothetical protein n=1 Tax=Cupriavidus gilardii TaxID=82541 RepID=UPI001574AA19|nr:hypothetical protein [Cupriavidus gilardii]NSX06288.1 hypothetical protein [Cupriavidus gilardii]